MVNGAEAGIRAVLTEPELIAWGERIGREAELPLILCLYGDLGAGKSTLARGVVRGAGIEGSVPSPTFNLLFAYDAPRTRVQHLDLYRIERPDDVWELGWEELGSGAEIVLIEWADRARELLPPRRWDVRIEEAADPRTRTVAAVPVGEPVQLPPPPRPTGGSE